MPTTTGKATDFITFSRASNATVTDADGKIKWAPHNLLLNSESFDASAWVKAGTTVTANSTVAPNGATTADTFKEDNTTSQHQMYQNVAVPVGAVTTRVYAKLGSGSRYLQIRPSGLGTGVAYANFDLSTGVVVPSGTGGTAFVSASVTPSTNGFYLCEMIANFASAASGMMFQLSNGSTENTTYTGDNTSSIILWGASLTRSDLGGMQANTSAYPMYNPTTPKNLLGYTEDFSNAAWTKNGSTIIANAVVAPNGLQTADKIVESTASAPHGLYNATGLNSTTGAPYVYSVYAKAAERSIIYIDAYTGSGAFTYFNLANGTVGTSAAGSTGSIQSVGDGWYRCSVVRNSTQSTNQFIGVYIAQTDNVASYTGDGVSGVYIWGAQLSDSASLDAYVPSYGAAVTSAAYYGPRRDFDPVTLACKGLLVEEQRTNLLLHSNTLTNAAWSPVNIASTVADVTGPDGIANSAFTITESNTGSLGYRIQTVTIPNNSLAYTGSVYVKKTTGASTFPGVGLFYSGGTSVLAEYTLNTNTGAAVAKSTNVGTSSAVVQNAGEFWRIEITATNNSTGNTSANFYLAPAVNSDGSGTWVNSTTGSAVFYGAQFEVGASNAAAPFATSLMVTGAASATRTADVASVSTQAFPYSDTAGTYVVAFDTLSAAATMLGNQSGPSAAIAYSNASIVLTYNGSTAASVANTYTVGAATKAAVAYDASGRAVCVNSGTVGTASGAMQSVTDVRLGGSAFTGTALNGHVRQVTYIPRRISSSELQSRTA